MAAIGPGRVMARFHPPTPTRTPTIRSTVARPRSRAPQLDDAAIAWERVAELGRQPAAGVTKHTSILVIGYQDARKLRPGDALSAKARKASDLRERGQQIEIMPEADFIQLLAL